MPRQKRIHGCLLRPRGHPYSVLLAYPPQLNPEGTETYFALVNARRPVDAVGMAQTMAADANFNEWEDEDDPEAARLKCAGLFAPLLLIDGHHYDLLVYP